MGILSKKSLAIISIFMMFSACGGGGGGGGDDDDTTTPNISLSATSHDFADVVVGTDSDAWTLTITNNGDANLSIGDIPDLASPFSITADTCSNKTLAANGTCTLEAQVSPTSKGSLTATLSVPSNDDDQGTATVTLLGNGVMRTFSLSESSYDFAGVVLKNSKDRKFTITNTGDVAITIGDILDPSSQFSIFSDTCSGTTLAVGEDEECSLTARFSPTAQGLFSGTLSIPSNDPLTPATIALSGEGYGLNVWINKIVATDDDCAVTVDVTVTDPDTESLIDLTSLAEDDFTLSENGVPISTSIAVSDDVIVSDISVVLAIDWSDSEFGIIEKIQDVAQSFVTNLTATDQIAVCKFAGTTEIQPLETAIPPFYAKDDAALATYIASDFDHSGGTMLYDAVYDSITRATLGGNPKKAVIVLSDGKDVADGGTPQGSTHKLDEVIAHAEDYGIPVFTIYYVDPEYDGEGYGDTEVMQQLAEKTGGEYYNGTTDLADVYTQISNTLSSNYQITYTSLNCDGDVSLDVEVDYSDLHGQASGTISH